MQKKHYLLQSILIALLTLFLLACSGGEEVEPSSAKNPLKSKINQPAKKKLSPKTETQGTLDDDFKEEADNNELDADFEEEKDNDELGTDDEGDSEQNPDDINPNMRIQKISFKPENFRADENIEVFAHIVPGIGSGESLMFNFRKNGTIIRKEVEGNVLEKSEFKKGDLIEVDVLVVKADEIAEEKRSSVMEVLNSAPKITSAPGFAVSGFKLYTFDVKADDVDGDSITYALEGDVPSGMAINGFTGRITFNFIAEPAKEVYKFQLVAKDVDGGEDRRDVTMNFKTENKQQ